MENKEISREEELDILELAQVLWGRKWLIIATTVAAGLIALVIALAYLPVKYSSYTTMYVKNNHEDGRSEQTINLSDINASKSLVSTYIAVLKSDAVMDDIGSRLIKKYGEEEIQKVFALKEGKIPANSIKASFSMSSVDDTEVLKISAKTKSAKVSADLCNMIADIAPGFLIRVVGAGSVEVIDAAKENYRAVEPNVKKVTAIGVILGFAASAGLIILLYLLDNSIKSTDELSKKYNKAIIGEVYNFSQEKGEKQRKQKKGEGRIIDPNDLLNEKTVFTVAESYKTMRTNAIFALSPFEKKIFAVTSANAAEGKSTTTANLAIAFAQTECRVLLIDADMRKPTQHKLFEVKNEAGLSSAISKMNRIEECINKNVRQNLDLMSAGPIPPNPSELLASQQFEEMLGSLADKYDYIIIDTPPVNVVSDVLVMNKSIVGVMFVSKHGSTTYENIDEAVKKLKLAELKMLGFILNNIKLAHAGKYYSSYKYKYGYGYGYSYGEQPEESKNS